VAVLDCAATPEGGDLHGSVAQEDNEQQVEGSTEQSAHKVGGHAPVGLNPTPVVAVEGVRLTLSQAEGYVRKHSSQCALLSESGCATAHAVCSKREQMQSQCCQATLLQMRQRRDQQDRTL
jgi:hypothetical protein